MDGHHPDQAAATRAALDLDIAFAEPGQEAGQRRGLGGLVGEGLRQQFGDSVLGLGAQPRRQPRTTVMADQQARDQLERPQEARDAAEIDEHRVDGVMVAGPQRLRQRRRPPRGEAIELVLVQPEQRRAQRRGERQVVLGRRKHRQHGPDVADGKLCGELHAVGPRDRQAVCLQRPDQRVEQFGPTLHENHDVARLDGPRLRRPGADVEERRAQHVAHLAGNRIGEHRDVGGRGDPVQRLVPRARFRLFRWRYDRPQIDAARLVTAERQMPGRTAQSVGRGILEDGVDQRQDRGRRAEGMRQVALHDRASRGGEVA